MTQTSFLPPDKPPPVTWTPTHEAAAGRLKAFLPYAGSHYARRRNFDYGPEDRSNVSALSPWVRHRLILEEDILRDTLTRHRFEDAEKFIQEVFWRGYFKGWLEQRPSVWLLYKKNLVELFDRLEKENDLAQRYNEAINSKTGITCFDMWANELVQTGYLHNHARMWFASIWIFTLKLPWELGADFFYRHLLDGDPASNTCSWRWVGGLHTVGKTYLARASNIERFSQGRFNPVGQLATNPQALDEGALPEPSRQEPLKFAAQETMPAGARIGLLITEEDCSPDRLVLPSTPEALFALVTPTRRSVLPTGHLAENFASDAVRNTARNAERQFGAPLTLCEEEDFIDVLKDWTRALDLEFIVTPYLPVGPVRKRVHKACENLGTPLIQVRRDYDTLVWPHSKRGFFGLRKKIPGIITDLGLGYSFAKTFRALVK